jgi:hypothetical protein
MENETRYSSFSTILKKYMKKDLLPNQDKLHFRESERKHIFRTSLISQFVTTTILAPFTRLRIMKQTCYESFLQQKYDKTMIKYSQFFESDLKSGQK